MACMLRPCASYFLLTVLRSGQCEGLRCQHIQVCRMLARSLSLSVFIYYIVYVNILTRLYYMYRIPCLQPTTLPRVRPCGSTPTHPSLIQNKLDPKLLHNGSQALSSVAEGCEAAHGRRRQRQKGRSHTSTSRFKGSCKQGS